jgi:hypothetical protein
MTKKRFQFNANKNSIEYDGKHFAYYNGGQLRIAKKLNVLQIENEELKTIRSDLISELNIVQNELNIAIDEGFAPSKSYKNYIASKKTEYDKFWENKIKTHNNRLNGVRE